MWLYYSKEVNPFNLNYITYLWYILLDGKEVNLVKLKIWKLPGSQYKLELSLINKYLAILNPHLKFIVFDFFCRNVSAT